MVGSWNESGHRIPATKARYATTDARKYADYVVDDTPAPAVAPPLPQA